MSAAHLEDEFTDLLIKEATEGLTPAEATALASMAQAMPQADRQSMEDTIALLSVALLKRSEPPPQALRERIFAAVASLPSSNQSDVVDLDKVRIRAQPALPSRSMTSNTGWWAAAAAMVLAVAGWWPRLVPPPSVAPTQASSVIDNRQQLLDSGRAIRASWSPPAAAGDDALVGDVVFDPASQRGFLTFRGIPANDPRLAQYQLWIVDARRKQPEPVDGGVFNVTGTPESSGTDVVIPFEARLPIGQPAAFVVTLEQPGGVVISKQERVLALAKVGAT